MCAPRGSFRNINDLHSLRRPGSTASQTIRGSRVRLPRLALRKHARTPKSSVPHAREPKYVKTARRRSSGEPANKKEKRMQAARACRETWREGRERVRARVHPREFVESHVLTGKYAFVNSRAGAAVSVGCRAREDQKKHRAPRESLFLSRKCSRVFLSIGTVVAEWDLFVNFSLPHRLTHTHKLPSLATEKGRRERESLEQDSVSLSRANTCKGSLSSAPSARTPA